ncbi:RES family NAD+ phosphorylase [Legionella jordanis]|uniref:RES domain-containing protein n=1 Tax=Legionella jordanis TaxID=456 RepID=A0A0W0V7Y2_9GAMM|nr:RES family NAD+ phosphorylase [Legionella jordanis]KTD16247.1 RES domain-containing protein [Legionella jordanis]RMX04535.1 RES domain-containing protein [Legionella jordanis]RMX21083.1 RES domain-containing protein [Legionella jordanis]VEH12295.1 RES domain-containing protein [Legionella jordanis]HAT8713504.1 RES domain-containing protein [Legionella jordanis]
MFCYTEFKGRSHRLIPSRYPPISLFDWAETSEELEQLAYLEGLTNDRLITEYGHISLVAKEDWIGGVGSTPLMAAFTHFGFSRFSDGTSYGVYYAGESIRTAIAETKFHRERFLTASQEPPCVIQMREYVALVKKPLVNLCSNEHKDYLDPDVNSYEKSQQLGREIKRQNEWGILYPSVRNNAPEAKCLAIFRPPALTLPVQAGHYDYIWDGKTICEVRKSIQMRHESAASLL